VALIEIDSGGPAIPSLDNRASSCATENSAIVNLDQTSTQPLAGLSTLISRFTTSHGASRRSHSRSTNPEPEAVTPGHRVLTASFATRKSRVQIPPAPKNALVRAMLACEGGLLSGSRICDSTRAPHGGHAVHLSKCEALEPSSMGFQDWIRSGHLDHLWTTNVPVDIVAEWRDLV